MYIDDELGKTTSIGTTIEQKVDEKLVQFLIINSDVFTWTVHDLVGIDPEDYLSKPPLLTKLRSGEKLYIYQLASEEAGAKPKYPPIEKLALALIVAPRNLHPYFQSHQVTVLTNQPLKHMLASPNASRRMIKWAMELSEHGIKFEPKPAIKEKLLAYFISEVMGNENDIQSQVWEIFVDGSSTSSRSGVGIVIKRSKQTIWNMKPHSSFPSQIMKQNTKQDRRK
ncbi:hypothetical protein Sango_2058200 [Sesamum angolense]|uniref:Reverse transcriptase RNase H-like domain-containing protein n=1 Tax=Sesamum angolense TaxID=2727404 RepID=A0AAE1WGH4_9LAMI|nr:hypothetical protein Sango_2058200 [Sesamum angolense]